MPLPVIARPPLLKLEKPTPYPAPGTFLIVLPEAHKGWPRNGSNVLVCKDGSDHNVQFQSAIDSLPVITGGNNRPGGRIIVTEGAANFEQAVNLSNSSSIKDIVIQGMGIDATFVKPAASINMFTSSRADLEIGTGGIYDLRAAGQWATQTASFFYGYPFDFRFERLCIQDFKTAGIEIIRGTGSGSFDRAVWISHCRLNENYRSVWLNNANSNWIVDNHITGEFGILLEDSLINHLSRNTLSTPSTRFAANMREITLNGDSEGNIIDRNLFDIWWSDTSPASFYNALELDSTNANRAVKNTIIQNNRFWGYAASKTGAVLIRVQKGGGNAVQNTRLKNNTVETAGAALNFLNYSDVTNLAVIGNDMGAVPPTTPLTSSGANSGVTIKRNVGIVTENSGASTGTGAQQTVAHGLAVTPTRQQIALTAGSATALPFHSADPDATNIYVTAALNQAWYWATAGT